MKVSIVTPVFNGGDVIEDLLKSIINQNYSNWELIIQDANSTDNTIESVNAISDERIKIYSENDDGMYDALNKAISKATGDYILHLNCDEQLMQDGLDIIVKEIRNKRNFDVYCFGVLIINRERQPKVYRKAYPQIKLFLKLFNFDIFTAGIVYKKNIFKYLQFNTDYKAVSDALLFYEIIESDYSIHYSELYTSLFLSEGENLSLSNQALNEREEIRKSVPFSNIGYYLLFYLRKIYKYYHKCHKIELSEDSLQLFHKGIKTEIKLNNLTYKLSWEEFK